MSWSWWGWLPEEPLGRGAASEVSPVRSWGWGGWKRWQDPGCSGASQNFLSSMTNRGLKWKLRECLAPAYYNLDWGDRLPSQGLPGPFQVGHHQSPHSLDRGRASWTRQYPLQEAERQRRENMDGKWPVTGLARPSAKASTGCPEK